MSQEERCAHIDALCSRLEDLIADLTSEAEKRPNPYARIRETHPNAGKPWRREHDEELARLFSAGNSISDLALLFGRTGNPAAGTPGFNENRSRRVRGNARAAPYGPSGL